MQSELGGVDSREKGLGLMHHFLKLWKWCRVLSPWRCSQLVRSFLRSFFFIPRNPQIAVVDWCALPEGLLALIASRLQVIEDFIALRATCATWRKETTFNDFYKSSCPKLPLLFQLKYCKSSRPPLLCPWKFDDGSYICGYAPMYEGNQCLSKRKSCKFAFPELIGIECVGSNGWFILETCLIHSLTHAVIELPKLETSSFFSCAALSASPSKSSDYVVMIACWRRKLSCVGFWKPGNKTWTEVEIHDWVVDLNYYKGKFYALTQKARVWMFDLSGLDPCLITELPWRPDSRPHAQLVECGGRLLAVAPFYNHRNGTPYVHDLQMVEIDVISGSCRTVANLESSSVFLGRNQGFSIDTNILEGIIEPNVIYFSDGFSRTAAPGPPTDTTTLDSCRMGIWINI